MFVRDIMTRDVAAVDIESSILDAAVKMKLYDVGMVVVSENGRPVGIVTDRDIVIRGVAEGADPTLFAVKRLMTTQVVTCREDDSPDDAVDVMQAKQVRRLVVLDVGGQPTGVVSLSDIAQRAGDPGLAGVALQGITQPTEIEAVRPHQEA